MVTLFTVFISFVKLYRVEDACKMKPYCMSFGYRFDFILRQSWRRLFVLHNGVIKIKFGTANVFSQQHLLGLK